MERVSKFLSLTRAFYIEQLKTCKTVEDILDLAVTFEMAVVAVHSMALDTAYGQETEDEIHARACLLAKDIGATIHAELHARLESVRSFRVKQEADAAISKASS